MALVPEHSEAKEEFYMAIEGADTSNEFVAEHVAPNINVFGPIFGTPEAMAMALQAFLGFENGIEFVADWPADFEHLSNLLTLIGSAVGFKDTIECTMRLINTPPLSPEIPHNALSDARALRDWWVSSEAG